MKELRLGGLLTLIRQEQQTQPPGQPTRKGPKRRDPTGHSQTHARGQLHVSSGRRRALGRIEQRRGDGCPDHRHGAGDLDGCRSSAAVLGEDERRERQQKLLAALKALLGLSLKPTFIESPWS